MRYDVNIIHEGAGKLYSKAGSIIFLYSFGGIFFGFIAGEIIGKILFP